MSTNIRALRVKHKLKQRDVAAKLGVSDYQMRKWERGLVLPPSHIMSAMANLYQVASSVLESNQISFMKSVSPGEGYTTKQPNYSGIEQATTRTPLGRMRVLDLFCGSGGLSFGLELTGCFTTVAGLDLLPDRIATFRANHPHAVSVVGDIRDTSATTLTEIVGPLDVIVGGPPCQGFSSIRPFRNLTEGDKRNSLIEQFLIFVSVIRPRWFVLENVVGLLTHSDGVVFRTLLDRFISCGYQVEWKILNSALFGVPQNRERLVIVGHRTDAEFKWPLPSHRIEHKSMAGSREQVVRSVPLIPDIAPQALTLIEAIGDLPGIEAGEGSDSYDVPPQNHFQQWARGEATTLTLHQATNHSKRMLEIIRHAGKNVSAIPQHLISSGFSSSYSRLDSDKPSTTLTVNFVHPGSNRCIHPFQDRALTPREGARIQSFPDTFEFCGTRAQIVKQIGNAVPPLLAMAVGRAIAETDSLSMEGP